MSDEKIKVVIDAAVNGVKQITSTTTATERLTKAIAEQRESVKGYVVDLALWQDHRTVFPFSLALEDNGIYIPVEFIVFFLIAYQAPFIVYMKKRR